MKDLEFKYEKIGHTIWLEEDDWKRVVKYLAKVGVKVDEASLTRRAADSAKAAKLARQKKAKSKKAAPAKSG